MDRHIQKNALVNLAAALMILIAAFAVTIFSNSLTGRAASVFLFIAVLIAFASWFQMRLEENEQLEKLEVEEMARAKGESALFDSKGSELFPARRAKEQFEKFFIPGFAVLLFLIEAGMGYLLWRWIDQTTVAVLPDRAMPALALFAIFALVLFLIGRFSVTIARLENHRLLRPSSSFLLAGAYICFFTAIGIAGVEVGFHKFDFWVARAFCILLGLMAAEILLTLLLEIYRPRVKGKISRPLYDSRVIGLLAQPESLLTTAAQTLDYQFGFKVSETWFFQLLRENLPLLLFAQFFVLVASTCVVFVEPGEQALLEHFGKYEATLNPGAHLKLPWPLDNVYRYHTDRIQSLYIGFTPGANEQQVILWTIAHNQEQNFLIGNRLASLTQTDTGETNAASHAPIGLITVSIPVEFQIKNVYAWAYNNSDPTNLLSDLATRAVVKYLAGKDLQEVISHGRLDAAQTLQKEIQNAADVRQLGVKIVFVGLQDIHPPTPVAADYENVVGSYQKMIATTNNAAADAIRTNTLAGAIAFAMTNQAEAARIQIATAAEARAALFTNQIPAFEAAPSVYEQRAQLKAIVDATQNARKYVLLTTNTQDVIWLNLEDTIASQMLKVNVPQ